MGALEFNVRDDGGLELAKSKLFIGVSVACEYESQFFIAWIPVNMKVGFSLGVGAEASFAYNNDDNTYGFDYLDLKSTSELIWRQALVSTAFQPEFTVVRN